MIGREEARGMWEGGREEGEGGKEGAREEAMMLCRERATVEEGRVEGRRLDEGNERGRDGTRQNRIFQKNRIFEKKIRNFVFSE